MEQVPHPKKTLPLIPHAEQIHRNLHGREGDVDNTPHPRRDDLIPGEKVYIDRLLVLRQERGLAIGARRIFRWIPFLVDIPADFARWGFLVHPSHEVYAFFACSSADLTPDSERICRQRAMKRSNTGSDISFSLFSRVQGIGFPSASRMFSNPVMA